MVSPVLSLWAETKEVHPPVRMWRRGVPGRIREEMHPFEKRDRGPGRLDKASLFEGEACVEEQRNVQECI